MWKNNRIKKKIETWCPRNLLITVCVQSSPGYELDPVLDAGNPCIHSLARAIGAKAHNTDLSVSASLWINYFIYYCGTTFLSPPQ